MMNFHILRLYLQMAPVKLIHDAINQQLVGWPNVTAQQQILDIFSYNTSFTPLRQWINFLSKQLVRDIESAGKEMLDGLAEFVVELKTCHVDEPHIGYQLYPIPCSASAPGLPDFIACRIDQTHNQVGMRIWEAALFLSEVCSCCPLITKEKTVLELGAGVGITSLYLAAQQSSSPKSVIITDFHEDVVDNCQYNVDINNTILSKNAVECEVQMLDWSDYLSSSLPTAEVVLAADCTYSKDLNHYLVKLFEELLLEKKDFKDESVLNATSSSGADAPPRIGLIACTVRNKDTYEHFQKVLLQQDEGSGRLPSTTIVDLSHWAHSLINEKLLLESERIYYENRDLLKLFCILPAGQQLPSYMR